MELHPLPTYDKCIVMYIALMWKAPNDKHILINLNVEYSVTVNF
jgi:hypothetical protein